MRHFIGAQHQDTIVTFFARKKFRKPVSLEVTYQNPPNGWLPSSGRRHHSTTTPPSSREDLQRKGAFRLTRIVNYPIGITFLVCYNRCMNMKQRQGHACDMPPPHCHPLIGNIRFAIGRKDECLNRTASKLYIADHTITIRQAIADYPDDAEPSERQFHVHTDSPPSSESSLPYSTG